MKPNGRLVNQLVGWFRCVGVISGAVRACVGVNSLAPNPAAGRREPVGRCRATAWSSFLVVGAGVPDEAITSKEARERMIRAWCWRLLKGAR